MHHANFQTVAHVQLLSWKHTQTHTSNSFPLKTCFCICSQVFCDIKTY